MKRKIFMFSAMFILIVFGYMLLTSTFITANFPLPITTVSKGEIIIKVQNILEKIGANEEIESIAKSKYFRPTSDHKYDQRQPVWPSWKVTTQNYLLVFQGQTGNLLSFERKLNIEENIEKYLELNKTPELNEKEAVEAAESLMKILHSDADYQYNRFDSVKAQNENYINYLIFKYKYEFPWTLIGFISRDGAKDFKYYFILETTPNGQILKSYLVRAHLSSRF